LDFARFSLRAPGLANHYCADGAADDGPPPAEDGLTDLIQAITFQRSSGVEAPLPMGRINKENEVRQTWIVTLTDDEIAAGKYFKPSFWKQLAGHARVGDLIEIWNARHTERYILLVQLVEKQRIVRDPYGNQRPEKFCEQQEAIQFIAALKPAQVA
jgi:hypothetical protein